MIYENSSSIFKLHIMHKTVGYLSIFATDPFQYIHSFMQNSIEITKNMLSKLLALALIRSGQKWWQIHFFSFLFEFIISNLPTMWWVYEWFNIICFINGKHTKKKSYDWMGLTLNAYYKWNSFRRPKWANPMIYAQYKLWSELDEKQFP